ncbi:MAG TPA: ABC transporter permease [Candidatus Bathyarchaeota archaeon]|nr:MAG: hypothetical protein B6U79_03055 [Candidatus Bathyarchaeota archaeon ex4484_231]RLG93463.1 MAG: hypothetical protein DRO34_00260 [Candidatus Bathyarchaeota archaeon]HDI07552.1 ABC transporter permease [Candidatus Bathyarchaeota archaeon]
MGKLKFDSSRLLDVACVLICLFMLLPVVVVFLSSLDPRKYIRFPPSEFSLKWYEFFFSREDWKSAFMNSIYVAALTTLISTPCGILAALAYRKYSFKLKGLFNTLIVVPYLMPSLLIGITILMALGRTFLGGTYYIVVGAHSLWATAFVYMLMQATLANYDLTLEEAAKDLGANPFQTFVEVTLPLLKSGVISAVIFGFITSFGEVTMAIFLTTSKTITLPVRIWNSLKYEIHPVTLVASVICMVFAAIALAVVTKLVGIEAVSKIGT